MMGDELQDGGKIIGRHILFYAAAAGERACERLQHNAAQRTA